MIWRRNWGCEVKVLLMIMSLEKLRRPACLHQQEKLYNFIIGLNFLYIHSIKQAIFSPPN